jgi:hypothetical protein
MRSQQKEEEDEERKKERGKSSKRTIHTSTLDYFNSIPAS